MEYTVDKLSKLAGISARTLRYYDQIGLLRPARSDSNGYRLYGDKEIEILQQIMFYRELGFKLEDIKNLIYSKDFEPLAALENHLAALYQKQKRLEALIINVKKTIKSKKGEIIMNDNEKFEAFKDNLIKENEAQYGKEIREKYGDNTVEASNKKLKGLTKEQLAEAERLNEELNETLLTALKTGDPAGEEAQKACDLHKRWLCIYGPKYNKDYHKALGEMYIADPRFKAYYDRIADGCAEFLRNAIIIYCK